MNKKIITQGILLGLLFSGFQGVSSYAMPNLDGLTNIQKIQAINNEITETMVEIDEITKNIQEKEEELNEKEKTLIDIQKQYIAKKTAVETATNITINNNTMSILEMLLSSDNISDFFKRIEISKLLIQQNNKTLKTLNEQEGLLLQMQNELISEKDELNNEKEALKKEQEELEALKKQVEEEIQKEEEIQRELEEAIRLNKNYIIPDLNISPTEKASALIDYTKNFLGIPYVWGGATPNGFDCSGLTSYVYRSVGVSLPRTASAQQKVGTSVALSELRAGDLIFFGSPAYHVGIYIGNGQYIHAPQTGDVVKIATVPWSYLSSATRVLEQ